MDKAILVGPCIGELWWEIFRFAPHIIWKKIKQYKNQNIKMIVLTRPDRFDIYGQYASILVPLRIDGDNDLFLQECFRLKGFPEIEYNIICKTFYKQFCERYEIIDHIKPNISKGFYANKNQFPQLKMRYEYIPRIENKQLIDAFINNDKQCIILASRFRKNIKRNWNGWNKLYDLIYDNTKLTDKYNFVICGKSDNYIPDDKKRFLDINNIQTSLNSSTIGITIELLKKSILTVGSQSAIPNLSLLLGVPALEWGHQKYYHTVTYNIKNTKVLFLEDNKYNIDSEIIYENLIKLLNEKGDV